MKDLKESVEQALAKIRPCSSGTAGISNSLK